mgnify:FL=1
MARKKYNYNFVRKPSEGGKEALYMAGASVFLFLLASIVSFAFRGNGGSFSRSSGTVLIPSVGIRLLCGNEEL